MNNPLRQQVILDVARELVDLGEYSGTLDNCPDMKERVVRLIGLLRSAMYPHVFGSSRQSASPIAVSYNLQKAAELLEQLLRTVQPDREDTGEMVDRYLSFLRSGCTEDPVSLLKKAGVDLTTGKPIDEALAVFEKAVEEMEAMAG